MFTLCSLYFQNLWNPTVWKMIFSHIIGGLEEGGDQIQGSTLTFKTTRLVNMC